LDYVFHLILLLFQDVAKSINVSISFIKELITLINRLILVSILLLNLRDAWVKHAIQDDINLCREFLGSLNLIFDLFAVCLDLIILVYQVSHLFL